MTAAPVVSASIVQDPECWCLEFKNWTEAECVFRDRCFSGLAFLHRCFSEWCAKASVPCGIETFEHLLRLEGFNVSVQLVYGLLIKNDADYLRSQQKGGRG